MPDVIDNTGAVLDPESTPAVMVERLSGLHPADIAVALERLDLDEGTLKDVLTLLDTETAADVLINLDEHTLSGLLDVLEPPEIAGITTELESDDAADVIGSLEDEKQSDVLSRLEDDDRRAVEQLLKYTDESAGGIMASELIYVNQNASIRDAIDLIRAAAEEVDEIHNVYVTEANRRLVGVLPLSRLVLARMDAKVTDVFEPDVVSVSTDMDQEDVAHMFRKYDLVSIPVVDPDGTLVGRITVDDIIDVIHEEAEEDITIMAGTSDDEINEDSALRVSRIRLPWLVIGAIGGLGSASVMSHFSHSLARVLPLAFFIPVITAMGGNVGLQTSTIIVRGMHPEGGVAGDAVDRLLREWRIALLNAVLLGGTVFVAVNLWLRDWKLATVVGGALSTVILVSATLGTVMPFIIRRAGVDPAVAQGPFVTTLNDIIGIFVYLGLASLFIERLG